MTQTPNPSAKRSSAAWLKVHFHHFSSLNLASPAHLTLRMDLKASMIPFQDRRHRLTMTQKVLPIRTTQYQHSYKSTKNTISDQNLKEPQVMRTALRSLVLLWSGFNHPVYLTPNSAHIQLYFLFLHLFPHPCPLNRKSSKSKKCRMEARKVGAGRCL